MEQVMKISETMGDEVKFYFDFQRCIDEIKSLYDALLYIHIHNLSKFPTTSDLTYYKSTLQSLTHLKSHPSPLYTPKTLKNVCLNLTTKMRQKLTQTGISLVSQEEINEIWRREQEREIQVENEELDRRFGEVQEELREVLKILEGLGGPESNFWR
ncbi:unnamed protein product [Moneuplotes crassus]|uniref:Uncharacterized protein n=1 Tax=Euplotes crassus TaxID=5936 RepID=A0AAD1Y0P6_EUPCR|nr:unnamed protein product [Moneuplotes crassus]